MLKDKRKAEEKQAKAEEVESRLVKYLKPMLNELNENILRWEWKLSICFGFGHDHHQFIDVEHYSRKQIHGIWIS